MPFYLNTYRYGDGIDTLWLDHRIEDWSDFDLPTLSEHGAGTNGPFESLPAICDYVVNYRPMGHQSHVPDVYGTRIMMELLDAWNRLTGHKAPIRFQFGVGENNEPLIIMFIENTGHDFYMVMHHISILDIKDKLSEEGWPLG